MTGVISPALARKLAAQRTGRGLTDMERRAAIRGAVAAVREPGSSFQVQAHALTLIAHGEPEMTRPLAQAVVEAWVGAMVNADVAGKCDQYAKLLQVHAFCFWQDAANETVRAVERHGAELVGEIARAARSDSVPFHDVRQQVVQGMFRPFADTIAGINFDLLTIDRWRNIISGENLGVLNQLGLVDWLTPQLFAEAIMHIQFWGAPYLRLAEFLTARPGAYLVAHAPDTQQTLASLRQLTREAHGRIGLQAEADLQRLAQLAEEMLDGRHPPGAGTVRAATFTP